MPRRSTATPTWAPRLLRWYSQNKRPMPWRRTPPVPYHVWLSEIMLQQTQVETATPYFRRFLKRFPSIRKLAAADLQDVLKHWEGLGYYSRARNLHAAAKIVDSEHAGRLPRTADALRALPGIGEYCSAAIASIVSGEPIPVVDGNVIRVMTRLLAITEEATTTAVRRRIAAYLAETMTGHSPGDFNQAVMELGALVCTPRSPDCANCPIRRPCRARASGSMHRFPVKPARKRTPHHQIAAGVIRRKNRLLVSRRPENGMLGGLWEFPGGKRKGRESLERAAARAIREETGLDVEVGETVATVSHTFSHFSIELTAFDCTVLSGRAAALRNDEVRWVSLTELESLPWPTASRKIVKALRSRYDRSLQKSTR